MGASEPSSQDAHERLERHVLEELRSCGQYFAMRGAVPGEQRFGIPEVGLAVLSLITWVSGSYLKAYLEELGTRHADRRADGSALRSATEQLETVQQQLSGVEADLGELRSVVRQVFVELSRQEVTSRFQLTVSEAALAAELQRLGLTARAAGELSLRLARVLEQDLARALEEG